MFFFITYEPLKGDWKKNIRSFPKLSYSRCIFMAFISHESKDTVRSLYEKKIFHNSEEKREQIDSSQSNTCKGNTFSLKLHWSPLKSRVCPHCALSQPVRVYLDSLGSMQQSHQTRAFSSLSGLVFMSEATYWTLDRAAEWHMRHISPKALPCHAAGMWCRLAKPHVRHSLDACSRARHQGTGWKDGRRDDCMNQSGWKSKGSKWV